MDEGIENLCIAIIVRAVKDARSKNKFIRNDAITFLKSGYAQQMTNLDLDYILREIEIYGDKE